LNVDIEKLRTLLSLLIEQDVTEFEHEDEHVRLRIVRHSQHAPADHAAPMNVAAPHAVTITAEPTDTVDVTSPFVGTFYRSPTPDAPSFADVGTVVRPGQTLCIIEAMKLMNEIESDVSGTVVEVFAQNGKSVEFGQKLFRIKKS
jgi:acetyl-CoA carboxylase biotin carboxyl carrier protein